MFAGVIRVHQGERHQTAIEWYDDRRAEWDGDPDITLEDPIKETASIDDRIEHIYATSNDESYTEDYIRYIDDSHGETRELIDNRNTYAQSKI